LGIYYWKENNGLERDILIDTGKKIIPVEIKMAETFTEAYIRTIRHWNKIADNRGGFLLYEGKKNFILSDQISISNWKKNNLKL
jgi:predicted AAA+ superfamily ATPase